jgi:hypothetical protein
MDNEFISLEDFLSYNEEIKATSTTPLTLKFIQPEDIDINERRKKHIAPVEDEFEGISANSSSSISIKNAKLIVSKRKTSYGNELIIKRKSTARSKVDTKLNSVLNKLPSGIVYKDETGMGATTLELKTPRHSIIVEPIKITASSKASKKEFNAFYVGSRTKYHQQDSVSKEQIKSYLLDNKIKYKKIVVVADSLHKVITAINETKYKDSFFLLLDEIDSFQLDSTYRHKMEECIQYYLQFKPNKRAMLSATRIKFSDPLLENEPITFIKYDTEKRRKLNVIYTGKNKIQHVATFQLTELLQAHPTDKFFVAFNSVSTSYDIIQHLIKENIISKDEVAILCSSASKNKVKDYYHELDSDKLPKKLNFFTSAYFTGFDLKDDYHLISISGSNNKVYTLSDRRLKQIAGRCRNTLLSETIIHDKLLNSVQEYQKEELISAAKGYIDSLICLKKHFSKYPILADYYEIFTEKMSGILQDDFGIKFTKNKTNVKEKEISYLNIDAYLEGQRVQLNLYQNMYALSNALEQKNDVTLSIATQETKIDSNKISLQERNELTQTALDILKKHDTALNIVMEVGQMKLTAYQEKIIQEYINLMEYYDKKELLKYFSKALVDKSDLRVFNKLIFSAHFLTLPESSLLVDRFRFYFNLNKSMKKDEVVKRLNYYFKDCQLPVQRNTPVKAVRFLKSICSTYKITKKGNSDIIIKDYNSSKLKLLKHRPDFEDELKVKNLIEFAFNTQLKPQLFTIK